MKVIKLVAGKQIKRRAFQSSSAQATSLSRESKNLRLKKKSKPNIVMIIDQLRLCLCTSVSHQAPSSTVRIPHNCVLLVCAFFTTPPPCVCQHNLWHCPVTVCATIESDQGFWSRSHSFISWWVCHQTADALRVILYIDH